MSNIRVSYKRQELLTIRDSLGLPVVFGDVRVAHLFSFMWWCVLFVFVLCTQCCKSWDCPFFISHSVFYSVHWFHHLRGIRAKINHIYVNICIYLNLIQPTISLEMPVPSQGHYGFHSFPVVD